MAKEKREGGKEGDKFRTQRVAVPVATRLRGKVVKGREGSREGGRGQRYDLNSRKSRRTVESPVGWTLIDGCGLLGMRTCVVHCFGNWASNPEVACLIPGRGTAEMP